MTTGRWQVWIDRGGTFTDCVGIEPGTGAIRVVKILSSDQAPLQGIRRLLGLPPEAVLPRVDVRMGTTLATNALLERKGARTCLVVTTGLGDLLEIGDQTRPDLFDLRIHRPDVLHEDVVEAAARASANGEVLERPDAQATLRALQRAHDRGCRSAAIVVLHAYRSGDSQELEADLEALARRAGFAHVSRSHEVDAEMGMVGRGETTVADAYLTPLLRRYVDTLAQDVGELRMMQSSGGLTDAARFRGRDAVLSGPAAGVVATAHVARAVGCDRVVGFDMGGTSTDVSRWAGELPRVYESRVAGVRIRAPTMEVHTVAAGGGSICRFDGRRFSVGPESAGADPGPLCYGRAHAREPTLTDVNVLLGRIAPDRFAIALDVTRVRDALAAVAARAERGIEETALGFLEVAVENMAQAIRKVTIARGHDVREDAMVVFGGAGGQHACAIARRLGIRRLIFHPLAGVLSAFGMGVADFTWHGEADAGRRPLDHDLAAALAPIWAELDRRGRAALAAGGIASARIETRHLVDVRYAGTEGALTVPHVRDPTALRAAFEERHRRELGYVRPEHSVEAVTARVEATAAAAVPAIALSATTPRGAPIRQTVAWMSGGPHPTAVWLREDLVAGSRLAGPALILEDTATIVLEPGFVLETRPDGILVADDTTSGAVAKSPRLAGADRPDPVLLEVFANRFVAIAEQMGTVLQRTALSTNIRERLDFSCAVFDGEGGLVANAPHIPVHLGAMGESVRAVMRAHPEPRPGDVFVTNAPALGGSHLPDVTVVTPVHDADGALAFFTASRGHHADVGGITPGSMPAFSRSLDEEGVVLPAIHAVREGRFLADELLAVLRGGPWPARRPHENLADLEAQIAANRTGARLLEELAARDGARTVADYMRWVQDDAAARVEDAIAALAEGEHRFEDTLDDGAKIAVTVRVAGRRMEIDFAGTSPEHDGNLNAPSAVTIACVLYVLRSLVGAPIPLNAGCLRPVSISIPARSLLAPGPERAVAGGNVETSQRVVDVLLGALGIAAASQGTMNNLSFGDDTFGYYETLGGGAGAGATWDGASAVHVHMTNSRITDPEVLESRFPVRLRRFAVRRGSGGAGRHRGGDGLVREIEALAPLRVSILSERRRGAPFGLHGGEPGRPGVNLLCSRDGETTDVGGKATFDVEPGDRIHVETPGGGGYGKA